ncbi:MAG: BON domain-containing protein [Gemmatimonadales bacterium]
MKSNSELQRDVADELRWQPSVREAEIGVAAKDGVVTLTGTVDSFAQKLAAERAAKAVLGVRAVAEELVVKLPFSSTRTDTEIAHAAVNALKWNTEVPADRLSVVVEGGWVTLSGEVDHQFQRSTADEVVRCLTGVTGMSNAITVKFTKASAFEVNAAIKKALKRSATVDADRISVTSTDGKVVLSGTVRSWAERLDAEDAAWSAPGVFVVDDRIAVGV